MHKFLKAIGFSQLKKRSELKKLLEIVLKNPSEKQYVSVSDDSIAVEYRKEVSEGIGLAICGTFSEESAFFGESTGNTNVRNKEHSRELEFDYEYYYPYFIGKNISSKDELSIERHSDKESYAGMCDDLKLGITLIFYLQNRMDYMKRLNGREEYRPKGKIRLAGLADSGLIMLPLQKTQQQINTSRRENKNRMELLAAAKNGDINAIENLTIEDMDTYTTISRRIMDEDLFSLIDTYFMPEGIESDKYSILGEIVRARKVLNNITNEDIFIITLKCNDLLFDVCINKKNLIGEPALHRRFKGIVWMQGHVDFE